MRGTSAQQNLLLMPLGYDPWRAIPLARRETQEQLSCSVGTPVTGTVRLATGGARYVSTGIKRVDGGWVHRNYLAR
jgi:hypothetical protein